MAASKTKSRAIHDHFDPAGRTFLCHVKFACEETFCTRRPANAGNTELVSRNEFMKGCYHTNCGCHWSGNCQGKNYFELRQEKLKEV